MRAIAPKGNKIQQSILFVRAIADRVPRNLCRERVQENHGSVKTVHPVAKLRKRDICVFTDDFDTRLAVLPRQILKSVSAFCVVLDEDESVERSIPDIQGYCG